MLDRTNYYRGQHDAAPLEWNRTLAKAAGAWAERCEFDHQNQTGQGENLYAMWGGEDLASSYIARQAVESWYDEIQNYDYLQPETLGDAGHFTQLVWDSTRSIGCNITNCPGNMKLVVCRYFPAGNVEGEASSNVLYPLDSADVNEPWPDRK